MRRPLTLGFIGGSWKSAIGNVHRIASQMDRVFELSAGCFSRSSDINNETGAKWGVDPKRVYSSADHLIEREQGNLDAVVVLTPIFSHAEVIAELLKKKFNVISEKPLASTPAEIAEIMRLKEQSGSLLYVTHNYTGYPMVRELRARVLDGQLGQPLHARVTMQQEGFLRQNNLGIVAKPQFWRLQDRAIPTVSLDLGVHVINLQKFLTGDKIESIFSRMNSFGAFPEVIDDVDALYSCENGLSVSAWWSKSALGYANGLSVEIFGRDGSARWVQSSPEILELRDARGTRSEIHRGSANLLTAYEERYNRFKAGHPSGFIEAFANIYLDIGSCLISKKENRSIIAIPELEAQNSLDVLNALTSATESARTKIRVTVPIN